jgi:hypothetical protein
MSIVIRLVIAVGILLRSQRADPGRMAFSRYTSNRGLSLEATRPLVVS